jgi:regulatory protein YycH of two-component signal transduction system YycFG
MKTTNYTTTITVDKSPKDVFDAINNVRGWWQGTIEGSTDQLGAEFTYRYEDVHYSKQKITELVPGKRIVWRVLESRLNFIDDKTEWTGTDITFDIARKGDQTEVRFTHVGLAPDIECYTRCSNAWGAIIKSDLRSWITTGEAQLSALG